MNQELISGILFRPAEKADCRTIAQLYSISSDGISDYIWTKLAETGEDIIDVGQRRYEQEDSVFSYKNCTVALSGEQIIGMLVAFPLFTGVGEAVDEIDPVLAPYSRLEEDNSYYICSMSVLPEFRGQGIGQTFLAIADQQAMEQDLEKLSLIVMEENEGALRLYLKHGYREVAREDVVSHPLIRCSGSAMLMVKHIG